MNSIYFDIARKSKIDPPDVLSLWEIVKAEHPSAAEQIKRLTEEQRIRLLGNSFLQISKRTGIPLAPLALVQIGILAQGYGL